MLGCRAPWLDGFSACADCYALLTAARCLRDPGIVLLPGHNRAGYRPTLERSAWLAIQPGPPPRTRSTIFGVRPPLKEVVVADLTLENRVLKKSVTADGEDGE